MSGNFAIKGGGVGRLMANAILNFHFDFLHTSLTEVQVWKYVLLFANPGSRKTLLPKIILVALASYYNINYVSWQP